MYKILVLFVFFPRFLIVLSQLEPFVHRPGSFMIGGLFPVHDFASNNDFNKCGDLNPFKTLLSEAHIFATDYVNENLFAKNGKTFTLGAFLSDTCNSYSIGLRNSVPYIKNMTYDFCNGHSKMYRKDQIYAVGGAFESGVGENINYLLEGYCIPLIGAVSTSPLFDNANLFPFFLRTAASDHYQARAIFDLLVYMNWTQTTVIYESSVYGYYLMKEFKSKIELESYESGTIGGSASQGPTVCVEKFLELDVYSGKKKWDNIEKYLARNDTPPVVILMLNYPAAREFFLNIEKWKLQNKYQFVGSDGWSSQLNYTGIEAVVNNSLTTQTLYDSFDLFHDYLGNLTLNTSKHNHWLVELIENQNRCKVNPPDSGCLQCTGDEKLNLPCDVGGLKRARKVFQVVYCIGDALYRLQQLFCPNQHDLCDNFYEHFNGSIFFEYIKNTNYHTEVDSFHFFNHSNSGAPQYSVMQYQANNTPTWVPIGEYAFTNESEETFFIEYDKLIIPKRWAKVSKKIYDCSGYCPQRQKSTQRAGSECCILCVACEPFTYVVSDTNVESHCAKCPSGLVVDKKTYRGCINGTADYFIKKPDFAITIVMVLSGIGVVLCCICAGVFAMHFNTPMARAALTEVLLALDISVALLFLSPVLQLPTSSPIYCAAGWIVPSVILTLCHALAMLKALRLGRPSWYLKIRKQRPCPRSTWSKFFVTIATLLQILVALMWVLLRNPKIDSYEDQSSPADERYIYVCSADRELQTLVVLAIPMCYLLISLPLLRRSLQNPFMFLVWQTRFILAGGLCLVINYAVMLLVYYIQNNRNIMVKSAIMMAFTLVTGYGFLFSMLFPIVYLFLFKKNQNIDQYVKRKRAQMFEEGNVIYMVTPVVRPGLQKIIKRFSNTLSHLGSETRSRSHSNISSKSNNLELPDDENRNTM